MSSPSSSSPALLSEPETLLDEEKGTFNWEHDEDLKAEAEGGRPHSGKQHLLSPTTSPGEEKAGVDSDSDSDSRMHMLNKRYTCRHPVAL